ncbi:MAG: exopolyphosphatase [Xanthobacteraceae bacterium]
MANRSKNRRRAVSRAARNGTRKRRPAVPAQGRLDHGPPVAVIDIGSNSVRLVVYEGVTRSPTPLFNEKTLAGLGREVHTKGMMPADAVATALAALRRFRALCDTMRVKKVWVLATAACRDAKNGPDFIRKAQRICRTPIDVISGKREAQLTALGVVSGFYRPDGIVGDLGGGSLELVDVKGTRVKRGATLPLGGLALQDRAGKSIKKADKIVRQALSKVPHIKSGKGRIFYAVGGTWRSLARLHMAQTGYPLHVMHGYVVRAKDALEFCRLVRRVHPETLSQIEVVASARRQLLPYAALVLEHILLRTKVSEVVFSALGVREGLIYSRLSARERKQDALIAASRDLNQLRSRAPLHGEDLIAWTDTFMASSGIDETADEKRLRHAACLLADIGWRAHPDYRGEQSLNIIAHAGFLGIDHPGRAYLALAIFFRHVGVTHDEELSPRIRELASTRTLDRARVLGAAMRVAYMVSASQPGVLPRSPLKVERHRLVLRLAGQYVPLAGDRVATRLRHLARLVGREPLVVAGRAR